MKQGSNSLFLVDITMCRLEEKLKRFDLTSSYEEQQKFFQNLFEFYSYEINKFKLSVLSDLEKEAMTTIETLPAKEQNNFFKERIREKLEVATDIDYQLELPRLPKQKSKIAKFMYGAFLGGSLYLFMNLKFEFDLEFFVSLCGFLFLSVGGGIISRKYLTFTEKNNIQKLIKKFSVEQEEQLVDFANRLSDRYKSDFSAFEYWSKRR